MIIFFCLKKRYSFPCCCKTCWYIYILFKHGKFCSFWTRRKYMKTGIFELWQNLVSVYVCSLFTTLFCSLKVVENVIFNKDTTPSRPLMTFACFDIQGFWYFARSRSREIQVNLQNPTKFTKTRKIPRNSVEILSSTCLYNIFETYFSYWGYLLAINLQIYLKTLSLKRANNIPKLLGEDYVAKNWARAMMLKALPLVTWDQALLSFRFENYIRAGKAKRKQTNFSGSR